MFLIDFKLTSARCDLHFLGLVMDILHTCISIYPIHMHAYVHEALIHVYTGHKIYIHTNNYPHIHFFFFFLLLISLFFIIIYDFFFFKKLLSAFILKIYARTQHTNYIINLIFFPHVIYIS